MTDPVKILVKRDELTLEVSHIHFHIQQIEVQDMFLVSILIFIFPNIGRASSNSSLQLSRKIGSLILFVIFMIPSLSLKLLSSATLNARYYVNFVLCMCEWTCFGGFSYQALKSQHVDFDSLCSLCLHYVFLFGTCEFYLFIICWLRIVGDSFILYFNWDFFWHISCSKTIFDVPYPMPWGFYMDFSPHVIGGLAHWEDAQQ